MRNTARARQTASADAQAAAATCWRIHIRRSTRTKTSSVTSTGWTSDIGPLCSASAWKANVPAAAAHPSNHSGCRIRYRGSRRPLSRGGALMLAACCVIRFTALQNAAASANHRATITPLPAFRKSAHAAHRVKWPRPRRAKTIAYQRTARRQAVCRWLPSAAGKRAPGNDARWTSPFTHTRPAADGCRQRASRTWICPEVGLRGLATVDVRQDWWGRAGLGRPATGHVDRERVGRQARAAVPQLEAGLDADQVPGAADVAAADRVGHQRLQVEVADRGGAGGHRVGDGVPAPLAEPYLVVVAANADVAGHQRPGRVHVPVMVQPDHQLGAVWLACGGRSLVEPDVIGHVVDVAAPGLGGVPAGDHRAGVDAGHLDRQPAVWCARAPMAALVYERVAAWCAVPAGNR